MYTRTNIRSVATEITAGLFSHRRFQQQQQRFLQWTANLPSQPITKQIASIEKRLTELSQMTLKDEQLLALMDIVVTAVEHLVASLHTPYMYSINALNDVQYQQARQIQYLYYLIIGYYDQHLRHQILKDEQKQASRVVSEWRQWLPSSKKPSSLRAATLYQLLLLYQKVLYEQVFSQQKLSYSLWSVINQLYYAAYQDDLIDIDVSALVTARDAKTIHKLYLQICLYHLLNIPAIARSNLQLIHRLLPMWAEHIVAYTDPHTTSRIFVNIQSDHPPQYVSAKTAINPYDSRYLCLFIELSSLAEHLEVCKQALSNKQAHHTEYRLFERILVILNYRYLERQYSIPSKRNPKQNASVMSTLNTIHEHISKYTGLEDASEVKSAATINIDIFDSHDVSSLLRVFYLIAPTTEDRRALIMDDSHQYAQESKKNVPVFIKQSNALTLTHTAQGLLCKTLSTALKALQQDIDKVPIATPSMMPPLQIDSLILLQRPNISGKLQRSIGLVRWLDVDEPAIEVEWQLLGHDVTACTIRLDQDRTYAIRDLPSIMIAADEDLQTKASIIVPAYYFQSHDRVILKTDKTQTTLHLQRCLISTDTFSQFEFEQVSSHWY